MHGPLAPLVFIGATEAQIGQCGVQTRCAATTTTAKSRALGWIEVHHQEIGLVRVRQPEEGDVVLHGALVGEPQQRPDVTLTTGYEISRRDASAQIAVRDNQSGVYFGRFFCMNAGWPATDSDDRERAGRRAPGASGPRRASR